MSTHTDSSTRTDRRRKSQQQHDRQSQHDRRPRRDRRPHLPAYGPIDAVLSFAVFYVFVERATSTVVDVLTTAVPDFSASTVGFGLAALLWFVLAVTLLDQLQRQLAAVGVGTQSAVARADREAGTPGETRLFAYLAGLTIGGVIAVWTFEPAVQTGITMIQIVGTLDATAFAFVDFLTMIVFFVGFAVTTHSLDRLVIGTVRRVIGE
ncbi:hypothetical protein [Salinirubrum litoreum]|uniref:RDD family protein n=1 Tax=Salinirubrum litoreum TaxID=1126234 RepID=A0ABD5RFI6_9EURY|nr:hypothetical protein [Salinirubrum litoreum]